MLARFPGIGLDENTTTSSGNNCICLCVPFAIRDNAASGSPCEPVHSIHISLFFYPFASLASINILLSVIKLFFNAISFAFSILLPNVIIFLLFFLHVSTICLIL